MTRSDKCALATLLPLLALSALMHVLMEGQGDTEWLLFAGRKWLDGKRLYVDIIESNPPLIVWLYGAVISLSRHAAGLRDSTVLGLTGLGACFLSIVLCARLLRLYAPFADDARIRFQGMLLLAGIFIFLTPQSYFFDREHIILIMTFPYLLRFAPSLADRKPTLPLRILIGLCAAFGFCIKPHTALLFATVQLLSILEKHSFRILYSLENAVIYGGVLLYLLCIWHFAPEYITVIMPMAWQTYSAYKSSGSVLLYLPPLILCAGLTFADFRLRHTSPYRRDIYYFIGLCMPLMLYTLINNGWEYTYYPLTGMVLFLSGLVMCEYQWLIRDHVARGLPARQFAFGVRGCAMSLATQGVYMALLTMGSVSFYLAQARCARDAGCVLLQNPYVRYLHDKDMHSFGTITFSFGRWMNVSYQSKAEWDTRFNHLWMVPKLLQDGDEPAPARAWILSYVAEGLAQDLMLQKPQAVFVETGRQFAIYPREVDLVEYFSKIPAFRSAWSHYAYATTIDDCDKPEYAYVKNACKYAVYNRTGHE